MKVVLYTDNRILAAFENIRSPVVIDNKNISWESGSVNDADLFILLDDEVDLSEGLTPEIIALDVKNNFLKVEVPNENEELKQQLAETNALILDFMESILV
jgi:hypothetical protein